MFKNIWCGKRGIEISYTKFSYGDVVWVLGTQTPSTVTGIQVNSATDEVLYKVAVREDAVYPYNEPYIWVKEELLRFW